MNGVLELSFKPTNRFTQNASEIDRKTKLHKIRLEEELLEMQFYIADDATDAEKDDKEEQVSFLAMRITPSATNGLDTFSSSYRPDGNETVKKYILVEFRSDKDFKHLLDAVKTYPLMSAFMNDAKLDVERAKSYSKALLDDSAREAKKRRKAGTLSMKNEGFLAGRKESDILLIYPFPGEGELIEKAARGLSEAGASMSPDDGTDASSSDEAGKDQNSMDGKDDNEESRDKNRNRGHFLTVRVGDYERLEPEEFLNDTLIDFWMQW
jgi:hypothetical protein